MQFFELFFKEFRRVLPEMGDTVDILMSGETIPGVLSSREDYENADALLREIEDSYTRAAWGVRMAMVLLETVENSELVKKEYLLTGDLRSALISPLKRIPLAKKKNAFF